jgi:uncharacterized protein
MKRTIMWVALLAFLQIFSGVAMAAPAIPSPSSNHFYVLDSANVLSDAAESKIQTVSSQLAGRTKAQVVVLTIRSLEGAPIDEYALEVLRNWGIGDKQLNNGVLILVAVDDRQSRIEVGYGLEGALPDGKTGRIQDEYMLPLFKSGDYEQGILNGYNAVVNEVASEYKVTLPAEKPQSQRQTKTEDPLASVPWWGKLLLAVGIGGLIVIDLIFFGGQITWLLLSVLFRGGRGGPGGGSGGGGSGGGGGSSRRW